MSEKHRDSDQLAIDRRWTEAAQGARPSRTEGCNRVAADLVGDVSVAVHEDAVVDAIHQALHRVEVLWDCRECAESVKRVMRADRWR